MLTIRKTKFNDLSSLEIIFDHARRFMQQNGNPTQWNSHHPSMLTVRTDIAQGNSYVCEYQHQVVATFAFIVGDDPTYHTIQGEWLSNAPYGTIHRMASLGIVKGVGQFIFNWCKHQGVDLRVDTHKQNAPMLHLIEKMGFSHCGVIFVEDGTPREAFQWLQA